MYMKWQLAHASELGLTHHDDFGGFSWLLPAKTSDHTPASLPDYVLQNMVTEEVKDKFRIEAERLQVSRANRVKEPAKIKPEISKAAKLDMDSGYSLRSELKGV